jgi:hypothetical protein
MIERYLLADIRQVEDYANDLFDFHILEIMEWGFNSNFVAFKCSTIFFGNELYL